jgi:hypothetical protein
MKCRLSGPFVVDDLGAGLWRLTPVAAVPAEIYLRSDASNAAHLLNADVARLELEWHDSGVWVTLHGASGTAQLRATTAIVHEARNTLYDELPLKSFDAQAGRFWRRVFALLRLPGGRFLLRFVTRQRR